MLIASLVLSVVLLVAVNVTAFRSGSILKALPWCFLSVLPLFTGVIALAPPMLQAVLTLAAGLVCAWVAPRPRVFLATTLGAFFVAYGVTGFSSWRELARMERDTAGVSMARLLAYEDRPVPNFDTPAVGEGVHLIVTRDTSLSYDQGDDGSQSHRIRSRERALKKLHEEQVSAFVNSPGFGVMRGPGPLQRWIDLPEELPVPMPESDSSIPPESAASMLAGGHSTLDKATAHDLEAMHGSSASDFVFKLGFGYRKDDDRIYGFRPHRISRLPTGVASTKRLRFRKLELVSLLKHEKPAVYVSDNLPRMSDLRHARTRPLDAFEAAALPRLGKGDLIVHSTDERLRVLGGIRAEEACLLCHAGKEGRLLGAFSYTLDRPAKE